MDNTVRTPVSPRAPTEDNLLDWVQREAVRFMQEQRAKSNQRYHDTFEYAGAGTGAFETAWTSSAMPSNSAWEVDVLVIGISADGNAARYKFSGLFKRTTGDASQSGATHVITPIEDVAAWDADFSVSGQTVLVQVKSDRAVSWSVMPQVREAKV